MMFINASSKNKPGIIDRTKKEIMSEDFYESKIRNRSKEEIEEINAKRSPEDFYSGCYGRAAVNFYAFNVSGNKGIACGLNNLQFLDDGEKLSGGGTSAAEDFGEEMDDMM
jgi:hypothetical protein